MPNDMEQYIVHVVTNRTLLDDLIIRMSNALFRPIFLSEVIMHPNLTGKVKLSGI